MAENKRSAILKRRLRLIAAGMVLALLLTDLAATALVFRSIFARYDEPPRFEESEFADAFSQTEELRFLSGENELAAKLYTPREPNGTIVVLVPGMHAGYADLLPLTAALAERGYAVFGFDPTGCRGSGGRSCIGFYQTVYDIDACLDFVESRGLFGCRRLAVIGHSRGGYAACMALSSGHEIAAVISAGAPDSSMDAVIGSSSGFVGSLSAYANYPALWLYQSAVFGTKNVNARASDALLKTGIPVLIVHGAEDATVRPDAHSLYGRAQNTGNAELLLLPGGHTDIVYGDDGAVNAAFLDAVCAFIESATEGPSE